MISFCFVFHFLPYSLFLLTVAILAQAELRLRYGEIKQTPSTSSPVRSTGSPVRSTGSPVREMVSKAGYHGSLLGGFDLVDDAFGGRRHAGHARRTTGAGLAQR